MRLACVKHAASVRSEPGSNSQVHPITQPQAKNPKSSNEQTKAQPPSNPNTNLNPMPLQASTNHHRQSKAAKTTPPQRCRPPTPHDAHKPKPAPKINKSQAHHPDQTPPNPSHNNPNPRTTTPSQARLNPAAQTTAKPQTNQTTTSPTERRQRIPSKSRFIRSMNTAMPQTPAQPSAKNTETANHPYRKGRSTPQCHNPPIHQSNHAGQRTYTSTDPTVKANPKPAPRPGDL